MQAHETPAWSKSRPFYEKLAEAKRAHKRAIRRFISAEIDVMDAAKVAMKSVMGDTFHKTVNAIMEALFDEETLSKIVLDETVIGEFPVRFLKAKDKYNTAIDHLTETLKNVESAEQAYLVTVFENLREYHALKNTHISSTFGIYDSTLKILMEKGEAERQSFDMDNEDDESLPNSQNS